MSNNEPEATQYVVGRAQEALAQDGMAELGLQIAVRDRRLFVSGEVSTEERRDRVGELLRSVLPEFEIHNQVGLAEVGGPPQPESLG